MSWDDGFGHKDSRDSPGKTGNRQEMQQEHPKTLGKIHGIYWDRWENAHEHPEQRIQPMECIGVTVIDDNHPRPQARTKASRDTPERKQGHPRHQTAPRSVWHMGLQVVLLYESPRR